MQCMKPKMQVEIRLWLCKMPTKHKNIFLYVFGIFFNVSDVYAADWFEWSNNEIQYLHGDSYHEPFNSQNIGQSIITITHSDGWKFGRNFFFLDMLITENGQPSQTNLYGEVYSSFSFGKILDKNLSVGIFKDVSFTVGFNAGENLDSPKSGIRAALYGMTVDFDLPMFAFFNVDFLHNIPLEPRNIKGSSLQITPVWNLPFTIAGTKWSFEGFTDFIQSRGQGDGFVILSQPQLRLDVGDLFGERGYVYAGVEYQYWHNKYGIKGLTDNLPQVLVVWKF